MVHCFSFSGHLQGELRWQQSSINCSSPSLQVPQWNVYSCELVIHLLKLSTQLAVLILLRVQLKSDGIAWRLEEGERK